MNSTASTPQMVGIRRITSQPQGDVRFDRRVQFGGPAIVNVPTAVFELAAPDVICKLRDAIGTRLTDDVQVEDVVRFERGVRFEFAKPIAFRRLERKKVIHAAVDRVVQTLGYRWKQSGGAVVRWALKL